MADQESTQALQGEFRKLTDEVMKRVTEYRERLEDNAEELKKLGVEVEDGRASMDDTATNLKDAIGALEERIDDINLKINQPRLSSEEKKELSEDERVKAFCKVMRHKAGSGPKPTADDLAALYPEGRVYRTLGQEGEPGRTLQPEEARALVEDTTGEILVPESVDVQIVRAAAVMNPMRALAYVRTVDSNRERYRKVTELSMAYGQSLEEGGGPISESTITPSEAYQYIEDCLGLTKIGENELDDSDINIVALLTESFARARADAEEEAFVTGAGHSSHEPEGITVGSGVTDITFAASTSVTADEMIEFSFGYESGSSTPMKAAYLGRAVYLMHPFTKLAIMELKDNDDQYLWRPSLVAGEPSLLNGYPVYTSTYMPQMVSGYTAFVFGDIRAAYRILDRKGFAILRLNELYRESGLIGFRSKFRNTGGVVLDEAIVHGVMA